MLRVEGLAVHQFERPWPDAQARLGETVVTTPLDDPTQREVREGLFGGTATFRKGALGAWRELFTDEHVELCKAEVGDILADLGYEPDDTWGLGPPSPPPA